MLNVGGTQTAVEVFAFTRGLDPATLDVQLEKGTLTIAGEREAPEVADKATVHIGERFAGRFRRVVNLPDDVAPNAIEARYRDGVLRLRIPKAQHAQPKRTEVQIG